MVQLLYVPCNLLNLCRKNNKSDKLLHRETKTKKLGWERRGGKSTAMDEKEGQTSEHMKWCCLLVGAMG